MRIIHFPSRTHQVREQVYRLASASVNSDAPELGIEILRSIDRQLEDYGLEIEILDNGPDAFIWRMRPRPVAVKSEVLEKQVRSTKQTSDKVSSIAAILLNMSDTDIQARVKSGAFIDSLRSLAASALSQDESPK